MNKFLSIFLLCIYGPTGFTAAEGYDTSLGQAAHNINQVLMGVSGIIEAVIYIAGIAVLCSAVLKYRVHRQNPQQIPISTVITELVLGVVLLCLPMVTKYANGHLFVESNPVGAKGSGSQALNAPTERSPGPVRPAN